MVDNLTDQEVMDKCRLMCLREEVRRGEAKITRITELIDEGVVFIEYQNIPGGQEDV